MISEVSTNNPFCFSL
uniref:Uncharacterized protein n=1 Tax=Anguilla anguilla TaxID=7936 RepID=A0A0E9VQS1_ANGAN